jgi:hypothetical protein
METGDELNPIYGSGNGKLAERDELNLHRRPGCSATTGTAGKARDFIAVLNP